MHLTSYRPVRKHKKLLPPQIVVSSQQTCDQRSPTDQAEPKSRNQPTTGPNSTFLCKHGNQERNHLPYEPRLLQKKRRPQNILPFLPRNLQRPQLPSSKSLLRPNRQSQRPAHYPRRANHTAWRPGSCLPRLALGDQTSHHRGGFPGFAFQHHWHAPRRVSGHRADGKTVQFVGVYGLSCGGGEVC